MGTVKAGYIEGTGTVGHEPYDSRENDEIAVVWVRLARSACGSMNAMNAMKDKLLVAVEFTIHRAEECLGPG